MGSETYQYDPHGQMTQVTKVINGANYVMSYDHNLAGQLKTVTYPSNRQVTHEYDSIGRATKITSETVDYLSNVQYNAAGVPTQFDYGNGVRATISYNARFQLQSLAYAKGTTKLLDLAYGYTGHDNGGNNGQITGITDNTGTQEAGRSVTYTYDAWGRLKTAATAGSTQYLSWSQSWDYDRFGNRKKQNGTDIVELTIDLSKNRATHVGMIPTEHDAAGNMTKDDLRRYVFDGESHLVKLRNLTDTADVAEYKLDGAGIRVRKCVPNCTSPTSSTVYVYSGTKVIAEYDNGAAPGSPTREYIYSGSQMVAKIEGETVSYQHADHLSVRVITDTNGAKIGEQGHYPFGGSWYDTGVTPKQKFTSYERDSEGGAHLLDYAMYRSHAARLGRFTSPDPVAGSIIDPQSLNRYAYSRNDPINLTDPLGLWSMSDGYCAIYPNDEICAPLLAQKDKGAGGGWGGNWNSSWWWSFFNPSNPVGVQGVLDFGGTMANAAAQAAMDTKWGLLPGNYNAVAEDENGWYAGMVQEGLENLAEQEKQKAISDARSALYDALLNDPDCLGFLGGRGGMPLATLSTISISHEYIGGQSIQAETYATMSPRSLVPVHASIVINDNGWFFTRGATSADGTRTGTPRFQGGVLLHELGHALGVLLQDRTGPNAATNQAINDGAIQSKCSKTLRSLKNR